MVPEVEATVRRGDVFALMISHHLRAKSTTSASKVLEEMRAAGINPTYYLDAEVLRTLGMPGHSQDGLSKQHSLEDEIEEQVDEDPRLGAKF
jgi:pentatricopeptide repeat protein